MKGRILSIRHMPGESPPLLDRVSQWLRASGYSIDFVNPAHGVALPTHTGDYDAMVIYGGSQSVNDASLSYLNDERSEIGRWLDADRPVLGLCLGAQLVAQTLGATVRSHPDDLHEIGFISIEPEKDADSFMAQPMKIYQWHNEGFDMPDGAVKLASGSVFPNQAYRYGSNTYGFQFHPEVTPDIVQSWIDETDLVNRDLPGAHPADTQLADAQRFEPGIAHWLDSFMSGWTSRFYA